MQILGFVLGVLIGTSLSLIGSGGSIFAIPILVYIMDISPSLSTTYSLFIVGFSALIGAIFSAKNKLIDYKIALYFGISSIISVFIMRKFLLPLLPNKILVIQNYTLTKDDLTMLVFSVLMVVASISMIKNRLKSNQKTEQMSAIKFIYSGILVGSLTGFVGVGGGFLIIPTLLFYGKIAMKNAVATSLIIIASNSFIGFAGSNNLDLIDWEFLIEFTSFSILGIFFGMYLSKKISNEKLKPIFGWFVFSTGIYILIKELIFK
ncbi:MAG: sulfite exporter TauE/SafE family protein [Cytophagales bacterium]|nr:MAG: sulfite exporter TauE/SafE family protein [Cytophagales bacterium]